MILEATSQLIDSCQFLLQLPDVVLIKDEDSDIDDASQQGELLILFTWIVQTVKRWLHGGSCEGWRTVLQVQCEPGLTGLIV